MSKPAGMSQRDSAPALPRIALCEPKLGGNAQRYLAECLESGYVSSVGAFVEAFEAAFAERVQSRFAVACTSGTAALHLACRVAGVGPDDEVWVPTLTFIASANPILYERARPVLIDAEPETWNLDWALAVEEIERRARTGHKQPKSVIAVHLYGHPARLDELSQACEEHGILLIEDAAEALGAWYAEGRFAGRQVGTVGQLGCFSFNGNKIITAGGGGMVTTDDPQIARLLRHLSTQARLPGPEYRHDLVGYNYRLTNLAAALGLSQLELLDDHLGRKAAIAARYDRALSEIEGLTLPPRQPWARPSFWFYTLAVDPERAGVDRDGLGQALASAGIETRPAWTPLHLLAPYAGAPRLGGAAAEALFARGLSLPVSVGLSEEGVERVVDAVRGRR